MKMHLTISFVGVQISYFRERCIKSYECLKILGEVWAGWACVEANEEELTTCAKNLYVGGRKEGAGRVQKRGTCVGAGS
jgi:hypothetical protein